MKTEDVDTPDEEVNMNYCYRGRRRSFSRGERRGRTGMSRSSSRGSTNRGSSSRGCDGQRQNPIDPATGTPYTDVVSVRAQNIFQILSTT